MGIEWKGTKKGSKEESRQESEQKRKQWQEGRKGIFCKGRRVGKREGTIGRTRKEEKRQNERD